MKVRIVGASNFVNRMFEACGKYQWAREFLKNSTEAKATKIEFGIEWQAVDKHGVYRRTVVDNGTGMDKDDLHEFFSTLGAGAKKIGGVHDHFGLGAKIASLPWNPEGVVVISYQDGKPSMLWIVLDRESGDYELVEFNDDTGTTCVIDPTQIDWEGMGDVDWGSVAPDWCREHGTAIILLGSSEYPDTVIGNPNAGEQDIKGLSVYLNTRFWDLAGIEVRVVELRSEKKTRWPQGPNDTDDARRPNNRKIRGAKHFLTDVNAPAGKPRATGAKKLDEDRVDVEWYLWGGERPAIHSYAKKGGYIAVRYNGELFHITSHKVRFRWFGVIESKVQQNLTIILDAQHFQPTNGRWGVHADQSRNRLIFTGNGEKGVDLPLSDWGQEFAFDLPEPIMEAIREARSDTSGTIEDEEYRKRLQDKFGDRWTMKVLVAARKGDRNPVPATVTDGDETVASLPPQLGPGPGIRRKRKKSVMVVRKKATPGGNGQGVMRETPVDVPRYAFAGADEFMRPWHLALWQPNDIDGPTVYINRDSPILHESILYHQEKYADVYADEVAKTVKQVFGEVAACKVAHSQKLTKDVSEQELDKDYRSEQALTVSLMGLIGEESLIAQRLGRLGQKKTA